MASSLNMVSAKSFLSSMFKAKGSSEQSTLTESNPPLKGSPVCSAVPSIEKKPGGNCQDEALDLQDDSPMSLVTYDFFAAQKPACPLQAAQEELAMLEAQEQQLRATIARREAIEGANCRDDNVSDIVAHYQLVLKELSVRMDQLHEYIHNATACDHGVPDAAPESETRATISEAAGTSDLCAVEAMPHVALAECSAGPGPVTHASVPRQPAPVTIAEAATVPDACTVAPLPLAAPALCTLAPVTYTAPSKLSGIPRFAAAPITYSTVSPATTALAQYTASHITFAQAVLTKAVQRSNLSHFGMGPFVFTADPRVDPAVPASAPTQAPSTPKEKAAEVDEPIRKKATKKKRLPGFCAR